MALIETILHELAFYGQIPILVMAANVVVLTWLGGKWGLVTGQIVLALCVLNLDLNIVPGKLDSGFFMLWCFHLMAVNLLLSPAWLLGVLLWTMSRKHATPA